VTRHSTTRRVQFKLCCITHPLFYGTCPAYLINIVKSVGVGQTRSVLLSTSSTGLLDNSRIRQLADWTSRGLVNSRTRQLAYWTSRGLDNSRMPRLCVLSFRSFGGICDARPRVDQSARCPVRELAIRELSSYRRRTSCCHH